MNEWLTKQLEWCRPARTAETIQQIDFAALKQKGINALIIDIDDTLMPRNINDIYPQLFEWFSELKEKFNICLTSNNRHPKRVEYLAKNFGVPYVTLAFKPLPFAFQRSLKKLNAKTEETAVIGDQLFMDILGGNFMKMHTIFVKPMTPETNMFRQWMRQAEKWVLDQLNQAG